MALRGQSGWSYATGSAREPGAGTELVTEAATFQQRYGSWALVIGGSDGLGADFAREIGRRGVNCVLVARRLEVLDALAVELRAENGIEVRTASIDMALDDAVERLLDVVRHVDLGLVVFNVGADSSGSTFLASPLARWQDIVRRNVTVLTDGLYHFADRFARQRRGGLLIVGSAASFGGCARAGIYTATKGFALNLGESLWAELKPQGVDVLTLCFSVADTPVLRSTLARIAVPVEAVGAAPTHDLARAALDALPNGPMLNFDEDPAAPSPLTSAAARRAHLLRVSAGLEQFYGKPDPA
jgi:short-subunit dehydrogenase